MDLNLGCPIELVYQQGGGCGLLRRPKVLETCIKSLNQVLSVPLTVKLRTGVYSNESIAHKLVSIECLCSTYVQENETVS